ncbi:hypothetical protein AAC387_Pa06g1377 [Persea americana]
MVEEETASQYQEKEDCKDDKSQKKRKIAEQKQPLLERSRISDRGADLLLPISYDHRSGHLFNELGI